MCAESDAESDQYDSDGFFKDLEHIEESTKREPSSKVLDLVNFFSTPYKDTEGKYRRLCLACG